MAGIPNDIAVKDLFKTDCFKLNVHGIIRKAFKLRVLIQIPQAHDRMLHLQTHYS